MNDLSEFHFQLKRCFTFWLSRLHLSRAMYPVNAN